MKLKILIALLYSTLLLVGCSGNDEDTAKKETSGEHVWKTQTDTIKTARDAAADLEQTLQKREEKIR